MEKALKLELQEAKRDKCSQRKEKNFLMRKFERKVSFITVSSKKNVGKYGS
jgi:hypothetical protein